MTPRPQLVTCRPGFSMIELIVALGIFSVLMATTLGFYRRQGQAFSEGNEQMAVMQNLRFGMNALEQNLRTAGIGVPPKQPVVVYAGSDVFAFNADYASRTTDDFFAVYHDPEVEPLASRAVTLSRQFVIPRSTFSYPAVDYQGGLGNSPAETIIFYFEPDSGTDRNDDYALYRQVNDLQPELLARHLVATEEPFFTYFIRDHSEVGSPVVKAPEASLPGAHEEPIHGGPGDTGPTAWVDSIRAVQVSFGATTAGFGGSGSQRTIRRLIRLPNAGVDLQRTCGNRPLLGSALAATGVPETTEEAGHVYLQWSAAVDETSGEQDVLRYVLWRRPAGTAAWGDPLVSVAAGSGTYTHRDHSAVKDQLYDYALAAQDCTPQYSELSAQSGVGWTE